MEQNKLVSEYYFEYKLEKVFGDDSVVTPKLYFERDYSDLSQYILYAVIDEWRDKEKLAELIKNSNVDQKIKDKVNEKNTYWTIISDDGKSISEVRELLPFDNIRLYFDTHGIDASVFTNAKEEEHKKFVIDGSLFSLDKFWSEGCRIKILNGESNNFSGVGQIEYMKEGKIIAKFFFAVNYAIRKKINYNLTISSKRDEITLQFECDNAPVGLKVNLLATQDRLPCLEIDARNAKIGKPIKIEFPKRKTNNKYKFEKKIPIDKSFGSTVYSLAFDDDNMEKYYILSCDSNNTINKKVLQETKKSVTWKSSCPYCHSLIKNDLHYKNGGISCHGKQEKRGEKGIVEIYQKRKLQKTKNVMYCKDDLDNDGNFENNYRRILPKDFLAHNNYKVAFTGSMRAGKTTYISRLFNINKNGAEGRPIGITLSMIKKPLERFNISINHAVISKLDISEKPLKKKGNVDVVEDINWDTDVGNKYYTERAIDLRLGTFPTGTQTGSEFSRKPFCLEAKRISGKNSQKEPKSYISFYDVAGEDAQKSQENLKTIGSGKAPIGVFVLINGKKDSGSNDMIINVLQEAQINKDSPIAVILTKFDILKKEFDGNCHCLRSDYLNYFYEKYDGSYLEKEIEISSEEIRSYLSREISMTLDLEKKFSNVKYFALSSFNYSDSIIHQKDENENDPGELKFESSGFRLELPLVWMLRQFGIIE